MELKTELEKALAVIAGNSRRGYKTKAAAIIDVYPETIYRWARIGWNANVSARVWEATERTISLESLLDEGAKLGGGITGKKLEMVRMIDAGRSCYAIAAKLRMQPSRVMQAAFVRGAKFAFDTAA